MNKIIPIDIYNTDLLFVIGTTDELKSSLEYHLDKDQAEEVYAVMAEDISGISLGSSALTGSGQVVLWLPNPKDKATLAHEIFHIACFIMEKVGIRLCHDSDEAYAYLIGYITKKVDDILNSFSDEPPLQ